MSSTIDTDAVSIRYREQAVSLADRKLLVTNFRGTEQEKDFSVPANCGGFGRIHHFRRDAGSEWPPNPLPLDPACRALSLPSTDSMRVQVFQNAVCNWRCWFCFVDFKLLAANRRYSEWMSAASLLDLYEQEVEPPLMIDLSGGQPDLVPEWVPWMMSELRNRGLSNKIFLWSDDNLSNDYFWRFLSEEDRELVATYPCYARVCCFKGFNAESFSFNTKATPGLFDRQFELMRRLLTLGIDLYSYVTLTTPSLHNTASEMSRFLDRLQNLDPNLPLRMVPLEVRIFTPVRERENDATRAALKHQHLALELWQGELESRFTGEERARAITDVPLHGRPRL